MEKIKFEELNLSVLEDTEKIVFNEKEIEIKKYLPISQRYDIIMITLQQSFEDGIYNPLKLDQYFNLNVIYSYTNIEFPSELREDEDTLYDILESSGLLNAILLKINQNQYSEMLDYINELVELKQSFETSTAGMLKRFAENMSINAEQIQKIVDNFDQDKYQQVLSFAQSANGGRDI